MRLPRWPAHGEPFDLFGIAQSEYNAAVVRTEVAPAAFNHAAETSATRFQEKYGPDGIPGRFSHQLDAQPMMAADNDVSQKHHGGVDVTDRQIGSPIVVQVPQCQAATSPRMLKILSRTQGVILKSAFIG